MRQKTRSFTQVGQFFIKSFLESIGTQACYVRICDEDICGGWEGAEDGVCDVGG